MNSQSCVAGCYLELISELFEVDYDSLLGCCSRDTSNLLEVPDALFSHYALSVNELYWYRVSNIGPRCDGDYHWYRPLAGFKAHWTPESDLSDIQRCSL